MSTSKLSLAVAAVVALFLATVAPSVLARAQSVKGFEYLRVAPYGLQIRTSPNAVQIRYGYRACAASPEGWTCREFPPTESSDAALRTALATLGGEGWELVSAVVLDTNSSLGHPGGIMYLFKRQLQG